MGIFGPGPGGGSGGTPPGNGSGGTLPDGGQPLILNPWDFPTAWRTIFLNDLASPGLCVECAGSNPRKWDKKDGAGTTGASVTFNGDGLAEFSVRIQLGWEGRGFASREEQWNQWSTWSLMLKTPTTKNPGALRIWHPSLDLLPIPICAVIVQDVKGPKQVDSGVWEWEIAFQQFRRPKAATAGTPKGAKGKEQKDGFDGTIDKLTNIVKDAADGKPIDVNKLVDLLA